MNTRFDLVIRNGVIVDGSGSEPFEADLAVSRGRIAAIGRIPDGGAEEIDARGHLVTPGFIDIHTHYDGQATWEERFSPSTGHGVTTVVAGNCGVGFAPCQPDQHDMLVKVMEGVEDIPEIVMTEGLPWAWETFPQYLDFLQGRRFDADMAVHLPHSPLRIFVMGERGAAGETATDGDLARMTALTAEAVEAGAIGVSTSRSHDHRARNGDLAPSVDTAERELLALAGGLRDAGGGVFQLIPDPHSDPGSTFAMIRRLAETSGRPVSFTLMHLSRNPEAWRTYLAGIEAANAAGLQIRGQVFPRPVGVLYGLNLSLHPFMLHPSFQPLAGLPLREKVRAMRDPALRTRLLSEEPVGSEPVVLQRVTRVEGLYPLGDPPQYEPHLQQTIGATAERRGMSPMEVAYDMLLERDGDAILYAPGSNYVGNSTNVARHLMAHENTCLGLGDGGAHYGIICDASFPTYVLTRWVRDARGAEAFSLPWAIKALSRDPAVALGFHDRGMLKPGLKADLNIIDFDRLRLHEPRAYYDLPCGGRRLRQRAEGFAVNVVNGEVTYRAGEPTGALPGHLVRGASANSVKTSA